MEKFICKCHGTAYSNKGNLNRHLKYEQDPFLKTTENLKRKLKRQNATIEEKEIESKQVKAWKENNKEKWLAYKKNYRSKPEIKIQDILTRKKYYARPEIKQKQKEYDASVSNKRKAYWRQYYLEHKEDYDRRQKEFRGTPRGNMLMRLWTTNRRTIEKGFSSITEEKRRKAYSKYTTSDGQLLCCLCFNPILEGEDALEHFIPISRYKEFPGIDLNAEENLGPAHGQFSKERCNNKKFDKTLQEWFELHPELAKQRRTTMSVHKMFESIYKNIHENEDELGVLPEVSEKPEITSELVDELIEGTGIEDKEQFQKGLQEELEHYDSVNKDLNILASIVVDHLKETPNYYSIIEKALADAKEQPKEEVAEEPVAEPVVEEPVVENKPIDSKVAPAAITSENKVKESVSSEIEDDPKYLDLSEKENVSILDAISSISDFAIVGSFNDEDNGFDYITLWVSFKDNTGKEVFFKSNTIGSSVYTDWLDGLPKGKLSSKVTVDVKNILCDRETKYHSFDVGYAEDEEDVEEGKHNPTKLDDSEEALKALYEQLDHAKKVRDMKKVQEITAKVEELKNKITKGKLSETIGKEQATLTFAFGKKIDPNKYLSNIVAKLQEEYPSANVELSEFTEKIILSNGSAKAYQIVVLSDEPLENLKYFTDMYLEKIQFSKV